MTQIYKTTLSFFFHSLSLPSSPFDSLHSIVTCIFHSLWAVTRGNVLTFLPLRINVGNLDLALW